MKKNIFIIALFIITFIILCIREIQDKIDKFGKNETGIPVLMYHFFYDSSVGQKGTDNINGKIELPKKSVILTIDDGNITFFTLAAPLVEKYEVPVTSFVITSAYNDINNSINILNSREAFCYPFGHYNSTAKQVLKDIGYKVAFTTKGGRVKNGMDSLELPRVRILRDDSLSSFIAKVTG